jgi:hypothetical protein
MRRVINLALCRTPCPECQESGIRNQGSAGEGGARALEPAFRFHGCGVFRTLAVAFFEHSRPRACASRRARIVRAPQSAHSAMSRVDIGEEMRSGWRIPTRGGGNGLTVESFLARSTFPNNRSPRAREPPHPVSAGRRLRRSWVEHLRGGGSYPPKHSCYCGSHAV